MILAIGAFNIEYIHDNCREPLKQNYGERVITINALPLILYLGLIKTEELIVAQINNNNVKTVFIYHDWIKGSFSEQFFVHLRALGAKIVAFYPDDEPEYWFNDNTQYDHHYDVIGTHSEQGCSRRRETNHVCETLHTPWGFNPRKFFHSAEVKQFDLIFLGKHKSQKEDGVARLLFLDEIVRLVELNGWRFAIFGYGWEDHPTLAKYWQGAVDGDDMQKTLCSAHIVLNPAWSSDAKKPLPQVKLRHFEVLGTQNIQLTNYNQELINTIGLTPLVLYYKELNDLENIISGALIGSDTLPKPVDMSAHSIDSRLLRLINHSLPTNSELTQQPRRIKVEKVFFKQQESTEELLDRVVGLANTCDYIHFISDAMDAHYCDYSNYNLAEARLTAIINMNVAVDFSRFQKNHLHTNEVDNVYYEFFDQHRDYAYWQLKHPGVIENIFHMIELNGNKSPIETLLIPPSAIANLLEAPQQNGNALVFDIESRPNSYGVEFSPSKQALEGNCIQDFTLSSLLEGKMMLLIKHLIKQNLSFGIYGARGHISTTFFKLLSSQSLKPMLIIDNGIVGEYIDSIEVKSHQALIVTPPEVMLICAELSGRKIINSIKNDNVDCKIIPVYDLKLPLIEGRSIC